MTWLLLSLALAADPTPPELADGTPDPVAVDVDGETWAALHPELLRYRLARSTYATQLEVEVSRLSELRQVDGWRLEACTLERDAHEAVAAAWAQRGEEWEAYADRVERRDRWGTVRDGLLVTAAAAAGYAIGRGAKRGR